MEGWDLNLTLKDECPLSGENCGGCCKKAQNGMLPTLLKSNCIEIEAVSKQWD